MQIAESMLELIGNTPLVKINRLNENGLAVVTAKIESFNPAGSVKDRPSDVYKRQKYRYWSGYGVRY